MHQAALTITEACTILQPPIGERALRDVLRALRVKPAGVRRHTGGRPAATYDIAEICKVHAAISPWLDDDQP